MPLQHFRTHRSKPKAEESVKSFKKEGFAAELRVFSGPANVGFGVRKIPQFGVWVDWESPPWKRSGK